MVYKKSADNKAHRFEAKPIQVFTGTPIQPVRESINAWASLDVPGLALHRGPKREDEPRGWLVTHIPSGERLPGVFRQQKYAVSYMNFAKDLTNWEQSKDDLVRGAYTNQGLPVGRSLPSKLIDYVDGHPDHIYSR